MTSASVSGAPSSAAHNTSHTLSITLQHEAILITADAGNDIDAGTDRKLSFAILTASDSPEMALIVFLMAGIVSAVCAAFVIYILKEARTRRAIRIDFPLVSVHPFESTKNESPMSAESQHTLYSTIDVVPRTAEENTTSPTPSHPPPTLGTPHHPPPTPPPRPTERRDDVFRVSSFTHDSVQNTAYDL